MAIMVIVVSIVIIWDSVLFLTAVVINTSRYVGVGL